MRVASVEPIIVSVPYGRREVSSIIARDGVTDVLIKITTDDGLIGWGEACSGANVESVYEAVKAMIPFVLGQSPWNREIMKADLYRHGLWQFRPMTANFAWAGIDMALWDICGKAASQPLYNLFGGLQQSSLNYFYYLARGEDLPVQCREGLAAGYDVFYLKVGIDDQADIDMVAAVREALGPAPRIRLDANASWSLPRAMQMIEALEPYDIDFLEQPVREHPLEQMAELRARSSITICANEGLWTEADCYSRMVGRTADVFCFSPYWVGSLTAFHRLSWVAHLEGLLVCKHTHGELGIAAAACHHVCLTLPNMVAGNQQTAQHMTNDVLKQPLPINTGPTWGMPEGVGLCIVVDEETVRAAAENYKAVGQYLPYQPEMVTRF